MDTRHAKRLDLADNQLEPRTLPASFIDSTFFQPPAFDGSGPTAVAPGSPGGLTLNPGVYAYEGLYNLDVVSGGNYFGFGLNPFGDGLSPLSGVVAAYSENTALSNELGAGSSLPGAGSLANAVAVSNLLPTPNAPFGTVMDGSGDAGIDLGAFANRGYGGAFSSGYNFGLNSANNFGMGTSPVGSLLPPTLGTDSGEILPAADDAPVDPGPAAGAKANAPNAPPTPDAPAVTKPTDRTGTDDGTPDRSTARPDPNRPAAVQPGRDGPTPEPSTPPEARPPKTPPATLPPGL